LKPSGALDIGLKRAFSRSALQHSFDNRIVPMITKPRCTVFQAASGFCYALFDHQSSIINPVGGFQLHPSRENIKKNRPFNGRFSVRNGLLLLNTGTL
jgi:hypothetical protein